MFIGCPGPIAGCSDFAGFSESTIFCFVVFWLESGVVFSLTQSDRFRRQSEESFLGAKVPRLVRGCLFLDNGPAYSDARELDMPIDLFSQGLPWRKESHDQHTSPGFQLWVGLHLRLTDCKTRVLAVVR